VARRRAAVPPPPRPDSRDDPQADTLTEWRQHERERATRRAGWVRWCAAAATLPLVAGGLYALPLACLWRLACGRRPALRSWGLLWAAPCLVAVALQREAVLAPTQALYALPGRMFGLPVAGTVWVDVPLVGAGEVALADPRPLLLPALLEAWPTGLVLAALLAALWGAGGLLEGPRLRPRSAAEVVRAAQRGLKARSAELVRGLLVRGYITIFFAKQGTGKTEYLLWLVRAHPGVVFYFLTEQTDASLAPYLQRWGLQGRPGLHLVTRDDADRLWRRHGHQTSATWEHLGPMVLDDAGRRGAEVFVMDTWTAWTGGTQDAKGIQKAMAPIREAAGRWGYAFLAIGHTNAEGVLLGSKEFERLCDISVGGDVVEGTETRRLRWVKDRSPGKYAAGYEHLVVRDLDGPGGPCYREVSGGGKGTPEHLSGGGAGEKSPTSDGGVGGVPRKGLVDLVAVRHPIGRRLHKAGGVGCTVSELTEASDLTQQAVALWLKAREREGQCERFAKRGNADVWRWVEVRQEGFGG
jgi:hypothetical protein